MSGGHFDYDQHKIEEIASQIESLLLDIEISNYSKKTVNEFVNAVNALRVAYVYAQRVDWLVSGDDGEESFHTRLKVDLGDIKDPEVEFTGMEHICRVSFYGDDELFINGVTDYRNVIGGRNKAELSKKINDLFCQMTGGQSTKRMFTINQLPQIERFLNSEDYCFYSMLECCHVELEYRHVKNDV